MWRTVTAFGAGVFAAWLVLASPRSAATEPAQPPAAAKHFLEVGKKYRFHLPPGHGRWDGEVLEEPRDNWVKLRAKHWGNGTEFETVWVPLNFPHSVVPLDTK